MVNTLLKCSYSPGSFSQRRGPAFPPLLPTRQLEEVMSESDSWLVDELEALVLSAPKPA